MATGAPRFVDLAAEGTSRGRCVVLPGRRYTPDGPLLFFAAQVALARDWERAFGGRFTDDADHAYGGVHVLARHDGALVGHASAVPRPPGHRRRPAGDGAVARADRPPLAGRAAVDRPVPVTCEDRPGDAW